MSAKPMSLDTPAPPGAARPDAYWRSLHYFNIYRFLVALLFLLSVAIFGRDAVTATDTNLFLTASALYLIFAALSAVAITSRWFDLNRLLGVQVLADIGFITVLVDASGGLRSGIGLLLIVSLAASSLISRGRLAMFHAAVATIAILLEQTLQVVQGGSSTGDYLHAALLSMGFFATAGLGHLLAKHIAAGERVALKQSIDLANLALVNQLVIRDMADGVLVVDEHGRIRQKNLQTERMLGALPVIWEETQLADYSVELAARLDDWRANHRARSEPWRTPMAGKMVRARIIPVGEHGSSAALIFIEDLTRLQSQTQQLKLAALGRLTANIAHEIRNPLSSISHATELLQEDAREDKTQQRLLQIIRDNTHRLDRMVQDVLQLNRKDRAKPESLQLQTMLRSFGEEFCQIEKIPHDSVSVEIDSDLRICFDRFHLHQILWNLCRNAWRHSRRQRASVRLVASRAHLENIIQIDVIDDGEGVPEDVQDQLFEPFFTTSSGGTGLGLYIARELCEANNASLDLIEVAPGGQFRICTMGGPC